MNSYDENIESHYNETTENRYRENTIDNYNRAADGDYNQSISLLPSGNAPSLLPQVSGLNWGAFLLNWIWAYHIKPLWCLFGFLITCLPFGGLAIAVYGLIKGNELSWTHRPYKNIEEFRAVQGAWTKWALIILILQILLAVGSVILFFVFFAAAASTAGMRR